jgi:hypothetical protein
MLTLSPYQMEQLADMVAARILSSMSPDNNRWLTMEEAMARLKYKSVTSVRKLLNQGHIAGSKHAGTWRIDADSVNDFLSM